MSRQSAIKIACLVAILLLACGSPALVDLRATGKWPPAALAGVAIFVLARSCARAWRERPGLTIERAFSTLPLLYGALAWQEAVLTTSILGVVELWSLSALYGGAALALRLSPSKGELRAAITIAAVVVATSVLVDAVGFPMREAARRPSGLIPNRNWTGEWLALALPAALVLPRTFSKRAAIALFLGVAIVLTRSRTAWNVSAIEIAVCAWCVRARAPRWVLPVLLGAAIAAVIASLLPTKLLWTQPYLASVTHLYDFGSGSGRLRLDQYRAVPAILHGRWLFGVGMGEWSTEASAISPPLGQNTYPHSEWIRALVDGGLRLVVPLFVALASSIARMRRDAAQRPDGLAFFVGLVVTSGLDLPLARLESALLLGLVFGSLGASAEKNVALDEKKLVIAALVTAVIVSVVGPWWYARDARLATAVDRASLRSGVPRDLLLAIAYAESRGTSFALAPGWNGWTRLPPGRHPERVAGRLAMTPEEMQAEPVAGLTATAALLSLAADDVKLRDRSDPAGWHDAVVAFNGSREPIANELYWDQVVRVMRAGVAGDGFALAPRPVLLPAPPLGTAREGVIVGAPFVPFWAAAPSAHRAPKRSPRRVTSIVVHTMEGAFDVIFAYFRRTDVTVGAHYLVRSIDGLATQMVDEQEVAFHDACFDEESIGIEHEGYVATGPLWYSEAQYRSSARIAADIATRYDIPIDRAHILGHADTPDCSDHTDPGPSWDWNRYLAYVREAAKEHR